MRYLVRCHNCSHGDFACDDLRDDQLCPYCQSVPASYTDNGKEFCWLHREPIEGKYRVADNFLFTTYGWRGQTSRFPNAKLYEAYGNQQSNSFGAFCLKCQEVYEQWLAGSEPEVSDAEPAAAPDRDGE